MKLMPSDQSTQFYVLRMDRPIEPLIKRCLENEDVEEFAIDGKKTQVRANGFFYGDDPNTIYVLSSERTTLRSSQLGTYIQFRDGTLAPLGLMSTTPEPWQPSWGEQWPVQKNISTPHTPESPSQNTSSWGRRFRGFFMEDDVPRQSLESQDPPPKSFAAQMLDFFTEPVEPPNAEQRSDPPRTL